MQADRDYDIAIAKTPRADRNGKDIMEDKLGGGSGGKPDKRRTF